MNRWVAMMGVLAGSLAGLAGEDRAWTNASGTVVQADYVSQGNGQVTIRRGADGKEFRIPIASLSEADQEWLRNQADEAKTSGQAAGNGIYIAVGNGLHRLSSPDGRVWTNHQFVKAPGHDQNDLKAMAVGNGVCVVVGGFSKSNILTTRDGVAWEINPFNMGVLSGVLFVKDRFYAFGEGGKVGESVDGAAWAIVGDANLKDHLAQEAARLGLDSPIKSNIRRWRMARGIFVGAGDNGIIAATKDFQTWSFAERPEPKSRLFIESDGQGFVVRGDRTLHHSPDGEAWTEVTPELPANGKFNSLVHDGERYLVNVGSTGWESADGQTWTEVKGATFPGTLATLRPDLYYSFETYWKPTTDLLLSTDGGTSWTSTTLPAPAGVTNILFAEGFPAW